MTKKQKEKKSEAFVFKMIGKSSTYYPYEVKVNFKPARKSKFRRSCQNTPKFLEDGKYFTPAFTLPSTLHELEDDSTLLKNHERKKKSLDREISEMFQPQPRSKSQFCGVCFKIYEEYFSHIKSQRHITKLKTSQFNKFIKQEFCQKFFNLSHPHNQQISSFRTSQTQQEKWFPKQKIVPSCCESSINKSEIKAISTEN